MFKLFSNGVKTNRDDWVYDFDVNSNLRNKALFFSDTITNYLIATTIHIPSKSSSGVADCEMSFGVDERIVYSEANRIQSLYRPFTKCITLPISI